MVNSVFVMKSCPDFKQTSSPRAKYLCQENLMKRKLCFFKQSAPFALQAKHLKLESWLIDKNYRMYVHHAELEQ